MANTISPRID